MSYIGQGLPADTFQGFVTDSFTGDGSATTFTLSKEPFSEDTLIVVINNVIQKPTTNFTVSGTTLTIVGTAVADGDVIYAIHMGGPLPIGQADKLVSNNLTINDTEIDLSSGDLTLDLAGDLILDAGGSDIRLNDSGTQFGILNGTSSNLLYLLRCLTKMSLFKATTAVQQSLLLPSTCLTQVLPHLIMG